jgi:glycerol-3-phosphate dehydrogenase
MPTFSTQLLIIGGGATGLGIAWDACLRGLKVVLVEQSDLGQGTSGRYHGLLHSGGRYVISDPLSASDCSSENEILRRIAPHTIEDTGGMFISTASDPAGHPEEWLTACRQCGVPTEEISPATALKQEPALNPHIVRAFRVRDASLDSFDLVHALETAIRGAGGEVWLKHRVDSMQMQDERVISAEITDLQSQVRKQIHAEIFINAAGPWANDVADLVGAKVPISLGKGTMIAMATRPVHTVLSRCRPPSDGDVIVPIGTVAVLGTTDVLVDEPTNLDIKPWEIDFLLAQGDILVPELASHRPLRAWAGIRPLYRPPQAMREHTSTLPRAHFILDHEEREGIHGFFSVIGGKLTTYRLMAEQTVDLICQHLGIQSSCSTADTLLEPHRKKHYHLPARLSVLHEKSDSNEIICECEIVSRSMIEGAIRESPSADLDDIRRDLRLGMGPCQSGFCSYRTAGVLADILPNVDANEVLADFVTERWRGVRPLGWGHGLRQMELSRRIYLDLLKLHHLAEKSE